MTRRLFRYFLEGRKFVAYTDHKPLTFSIAKISDSWSSLQQRHLAYISEFTTDIRHVQVWTTTSQMHCPEPPLLLCRRIWIMMPWLLARRMTQRLEFTAQPSQGSSLKTFHLVHRVLHFSVMFLLATPDLLFLLGGDVKFLINPWPLASLYVCHKKAHGNKVHLAWFTEAGGYLG